MDFNIKKPTHIFALILISITFIVIVVLPVANFLNPYQSTASNIGKISGPFKIIFEIFFIFFQLVIVFILLVFFPIIWYAIVNKASLKEIFSKLKLKSENIGNAIIFGFVLAAVVFVIGIIAGIIFTQLFKVESRDVSNITDLEALFSPLTLFILVAIQPIAEEIFFRGFLLDKLEYMCGEKVAILSTAILFGLSHATYVKIYPVILAVITGILLAYAVVKTKNLFTSITAHICFNVVSLAIYFLGKQFIT